MTNPGTSNHMTEEYEMSDLVVLIPGIMGSALAVDGKPAWALSGRALARGILTLGRSVTRLTLPANFDSAFPAEEGQGEPNDGIKATHLLADLHAIPGLWTPVKGYDRVAKMFRQRFKLNRPADAVNFIEFPYDWRLSNAVSARRLSKVVVPALERWRRVKPEAKLVLICHSMGGLVARWFLEMLGGAELTRTLISIATPYLGSINAFQTAYDGLFPILGNLQAPLTRMVRSFPGLHELLPVYPCLDRGSGELRLLTEDAGGLDVRMVDAAAEFHGRLKDKVLMRKTPPPYEIIAIKGIDQPTLQTARLRDGKLELLRSFKGQDKEGDGTVPRPSAHPPEWERESGHSVIFAAQKHGTLQETDSVHVQLYGQLSGRLGQFMGATPLGLQSPSHLAAGEALEFTVQSEDAGLALKAELFDHDTGIKVNEIELLTNLGSGVYRGAFPAMKPGNYQFTVDSASMKTRVDPVSDVAVVWNSYDFLT